MPGSTIVGWPRPTCFSGKRWAEPTLRRPLGQPLKTQRSKPQVVEELCEDSLRPKVFLGDRPRRPTVTFVVRIDGLECGENLVHGVEGEQSLARWQSAAEA